MECEGDRNSQKGYIESVPMCDMCSGKWILDDLESLKKSCQKDCLESNYTCVSPSLLDLWGGDIVKVNPNGGECGGVLPECSLSSSSEENSSSSEYSSSSENISSSSLDENESSSDMASSSSSDENYNFLKGAFPCYYGNGRGCDLVGYASCNRLPMADIPEVAKDQLIFPSCSFEKGKVIFSYPAHIAMIKLNFDYFGCQYDKNDCRGDDYGESLAYPFIMSPFFYCSNLLSTPNGCRSYFSSGFHAVYDVVIDEQMKLEERDSRAVDVSYYYYPHDYYPRDDVDKQLKKLNFCGRAYWGNFDELAYYDSQEYIDAEEKWFHTEFYPSNFTDAQAVSLGNEALEYYQRVDVVYFSEDGRVYSMRPLNYEHNLEQATVANVLAECKRRALEYEQSLNSSSSFESSSSESSSSEESSSSDESSSSEGLSSSEMESSSSSEMKESSSSEVQSSSSDAFVAGADQVYAPGQIFRSGLQNMEPGACYSLNPDRGTIYGWNISYDASDTWWWQKVDCETGEKAVGNGIGACSAYSESVPLNVSGCYSYNGSCYICDKSKGDYVDCNADWLWKYNFPYHDWFKQVDCYDPYEEEDFFSEQCNVSNALYKKSNQRAVYIKETYLNPSIIKNEYYDVLGRKDNKKTKFIKLYNLDFSPSHIKIAQITYRGHVNAVINIGWEFNCRFPPVEKDGEKEYTYNAYMRTVIYEPEYENEALKEHEERHRELYRNPNVSNVQLDNMSVKVPKGTRKKDVCLNIVASFWNVMELKLNSMFNAQNQIDYNDNQDHLSYPSVQDSVEKYHNLQLRKCYSK